MRGLAGLLEACHRCPILRSGRCYFSTSPRGSPLLLEFAWRQVAERRVDAFDVVDVIEKAGELPLGIGEVVVLGEIHLLFFDGAHESLGIAVFTRLAESSPCSG